MVAVSRGRRPVGVLVAAAVVVTSLAVLPGAIGSAGADEVGDKRAQAQAIAAKIDQLNMQIEQYAEQANAAQVELVGLNQQVAAAQDRVAAAEAQLAVHRAEIKVYAVNAYVHGDQTETAALAESTTDANDYGQREGYLSAAATNRQQMIDQLRATEDDVQNQITLLNAAKSAAEAKTADLASRQSSARDAVSQQQQLKQQTDAEVTRLVQEEQTRKAAEQAAAATARYAELQAQLAAKEAAAKPVVVSKTTSATGGGSPSSDGTSSSKTSSAGTTSSSSGGSSTPVAASDHDVAAVIAAARAQLGKPYVWGAAGPGGFDCSGLTQWAWRAGGVSLPHFSGAQYAQTTHVALSDLQPGDLVFYNDPDDHVALYIGGGQIIHAPHTGDVVRIESLYYWNVSMWASRP
jgi:peptidoglycan DL-endopeptidase CwlO